MARAYVVENSTSTTLRALNYTPEVELFRKLSKSRDTMRLGSLLSAMGPAFGRVFIRYDCAPEYGEELLGQSDMFAAEPHGRVIRGDALRKLEDHRIAKWQVLIAGAGTLGENELYGRSIIADGRLQGKIVGPDANVLVFEEPGGVESLFAYAFLCTRVGIRAVRSTSYGTKLLRQRQDILADLPIPKADKATMERVAELIRTAVEERESYLKSVQAARAVVGDLPVVQEALRLCRARNARCTLWSGGLPSLSAWNCVSAGTAPQLLRERWAARLGDVVPEEGVFRGGRHKRLRCSVPHGVDFLSQRDVFAIRAVPQRVVRPTGADASLFPGKGTLLVGGQGTLGEGEIFGRVAPASPEWAGSAVTEHLLRIVPSGIAFGLVYAFLSTKLGFRLIRSTAVGTKLLSLRPDLLRQLPIPELDFCPTCDSRLADCGRSSCKGASPYCGIRSHPHHRRRGPPRMARIIEPPHGSGPQGPFEALCVERFRRDLPDDGYWVLPNFVVKEHNRRALEYDFVILAPHAVFVIEVKEWRGRVSGDDTEWLLNGRPRRCILEQVNFKAKVLKSKLGPIATSVEFVELMIVTDECQVVLRGGWSGHLLPLTKAIRYLQHPTRFGLRGKDNTPLFDRIRRNLEGVWGSRTRGQRQRIGSYRIEETLRLEEGFGEYLCSHAHLDLQDLYRVRLWTVSSYLSSDDRASRMEVIRRPSQALADIGRHPNLVRIVAFDEDQDHNEFYEVTDWTEAGTLHGYLNNQERDRLTLRQRLEIGLGVAQALVAVHKAGIVHRAICPESVLLGPGLKPLVTDFDRAYLPSGGRTVFPDTEARNKAYVAPELSGISTDRSNTQADQYSLGVLLYELFVGQPPFDGPEAAIAEQGAPQRLPSDVRALTPADLDTLVLDLLNLDPKDRPVATEAQERLIEMLRGTDETRSPRPELEPNPDAPVTFEVGNILEDRYRIDGELGEGGFSKVFKVFHLEHQRHYAMKLLLRGFDAQTAIQEFQTGQDLPSHPNIARTIWMDRLSDPDRTPFVLSELIEGEDLVPYSRGEKVLPFSDIKTIALQLLDALAEMHPQVERIAELRGRTLTDAESNEYMELREKGILHRDIKPANIMLDEWTGRPKIIDFNIAAHHRDASGFGGTPEYWARDRGYPSWLPDADLFSLGLVLYELVTHEHPYADRSPEQGEPQPPQATKRGARISDELGAFLLKAVQPTRDQRFQTAREMKAALEAVVVLHAASAPAAEVASGSFPGLTLGEDEKGRANYNPYVTRLLSLYSQARRTNAGTRGLDEIAKLTYVRTRMDTQLTPALMDGKFRLVLITGNAGDGKTAYLQQLEGSFESNGAAINLLASENGAEWSYGGVSYRSNYDGSQDEGETSSDDVLADFLSPFEGNSIAGLGGGSARLIAINEGRLLDFLDHGPHKARFTGLRKAVRAILDGDDEPPEGMLLVNLNLRALATNGQDSILDQQLAAMLHEQLWASCESCDHKERCPLLHNARTLSDSAVGPAVRSRLQRLFEIVHLRRQQHITMRDLRSVLSWVLLRDHGCDDVALILGRADTGPSDLGKLYYFEAFAHDRTPESTVQDRVVRLLQGIDVGRVENPALDRRLYHHPWNAVAWMSVDSRSPYERKVLSALIDATTGPSDSDDARRVIASQRSLMSSFRRRAYFERRDEGWRKMLPYSSLMDLERALMLEDGPEATKVRDALLSDVIEAISMLEGVRHPQVRREFLCLRATRTKNASVLSFRLFPRSAFHLRVDRPKTLARYIELKPDSLRLVVAEEVGRAVMRISLDLLEMFELIRRGYRPTAADMRGLFVNLLIFRNELLHLPYQEVLVTQDGESFYEVSAAMVASGDLALRIRPRDANAIGGT